MRLLDANIFLRAIFRADTDHDIPASQSNAATHTGTPSSTESVSDKNVALNVPAARACP